MTDRCDIPRCRAEAEIDYLGFGICLNHWNRYTADGVPPDRLKKVLGIEVELPAAMEEPMESPNETVSETPTEAKPAETAAKEETAMPSKKTAKKKTEAKASKTGQKRKAAKPAKEPKANKDTGPKPSRTFAIRITDDELAAIHKAAGPRNATRLVRAVVAAFAAEDEAAFKSVVKEARELRG